jgi:hypothetical protein
MWMTCFSRYASKPSGFVSKMSPPTVSDVATVLSTGDGTMHMIESGIHAAVFFWSNAFPAPLARDASRASMLHRYERSVARANAPAEATNTE